MASLQAVGPGFSKVRHERGFTLIELVTVIVITGILAAVVGLFIGSPVQGFVDQSRRAALVDAADLALLRISRDVRTALPNSVRISSDGDGVELFRTLDGERYRAESPGTDDDRLQIGQPDAAFDTFGPLGSDAFASHQRLAVYPFGGAQGNPYALVPAGQVPKSVVTPAGILQSRDDVTLNGNTESRLTLSTAYNFPYASPGNHIYLVDGPVSYVCVGDQLLRYADYPVQASPPSAATLATLATPDVVVDHIQDCSFRYNPSSQTSATAARNAVVQMALVMAGPDAPEERVRLSRQVHVDNSP